MEKRKGTWIRRFLQLLTDEELEQLHSSFGKRELLEGVSRGFIIDKIQREISDEEFWKSEYTLRLVPSKLNQMVSLIELTLLRLEKADLIKICQDLGREKIVTEEMKKSKVIKEIFTNIPILELWRSKRLQDRLKPRYRSKPFQL